MGIRREEIIATLGEASDHNWSLDFDHKWNKGNLKLKYWIIFLSSLPNVVHRRYCRRNKKTRRRSLRRLPLRRDWGPVWQCLGWLRKAHDCNGSPWSRGMWQYGGSSVRLKSYIVQRAWFGLRHRYGWPITKKTWNGITGWDRRKSRNARQSSGQIMLRRTGAHVPWKTQGIPWPLPQQIWHNHRRRHPRRRSPYEWGLRRDDPRP